MVRVASGFSFRVDGAAVDGCAKASAKDPAGIVGLLSCLKARPSDLELAAVVFTSLATLVGKTGANGAESGRRGSERPVTRRPRVARAFRDDNVRRFHGRRRVF